MKNACIVGYGSIGPVHAHAIDLCDDATLYAICDIDKEAADKGAKEHNSKAIYSFEEAVKDPSIDVIHICTPHYLHAQMAMDAIANGKDVVLEKPAAMTKSEFEKLYEFYLNHDKKILVCFQNRSNPCVKMMKELFDNDKTLGELKGITGTLRWCRMRDYYDRAEWRGTWDYEGGGVIINQSSHLVDMMLLFGGSPEGVKASISTKMLEDAIEVEDTADALFFFENGLRASFFATNTYSSNLPYELELSFENSILRYADNFLYRIDKGKMPEVICSDNKNHPGKDYWGSGHQTVINDFYMSLEGKGNDFLSIDKALSSTYALYAMYESAKYNGKKTEIKKDKLKWTK